MSGRDDEGSVAHEVAVCAIHGEVALRVAGDAAVVLLVPGVSEKHNALNLVADSGGQSRDGAGNQSGALAVSKGSVR